MVFEFYWPYVGSREELLLPLFSSYVACGFPSPAEDFIQERISLDKYLVRNPTSTFYARVKGTSMEGAMIFPDSLLVIDRSITPDTNSSCMCIVNGEFTIKKIRRDSKTGKIFLMPDSKSFTHVIEVTDEMEFEIWGVITYVINKPK